MDTMLVDSSLAPSLFMDTGKNNYFVLCLDQKSSQSRSFSIWIDSILAATFCNSSSFQIAFKDSPVWNV